MGFFKKSVADSFSQEEKQEGEVSMFYGVATIAVIIEAILAVAYCADFAASKDYSEIAQGVFFIFLVLLSLSLISLQQYGYMKFARAVIYTKTWKDDFWWGLLTFCISLLFFVVDYNGGKHLLDNINGYDPKIKHYNDDNNYLELSKDRAKLEIEKNEINARFEKSISLCFECQAIEEEYKKKIIPNKRSSKPSEQAWVNALNARAQLSNKRLEAEKNRKISLVSASMERERDTKLDAVQLKIDKIDGDKKILSSKIDNENDGEKQKGKAKQESNSAISFFITPITQFLLFLMRWLIMKKMREEEKEWVEKGLFLKIYKFFGFIAQWIDTYFFVIAKKSETNMANRRIVALDLVAAHRDSFNDDRIGISLKAKSVAELSKMIETTTGGAVLHEETTPIETDEEDKKKSEIIEKKEEKVTEFDGTLQKNSDLEIIEKLIYGLNSLLTISDDEQSGIIHKLINGLEQLKTSY